MYKEPKGKPRFLSMEEEKMLLGKLGPIHGPWARLAILTGLRQAEQFRLQWKDVDLERGILTLPTTKTGGVPISMRKPRRFCEDSIRGSGRSESFPRRTRRPRWVPGTSITVFGGLR